MHVHRAEIGFDAEGKVLAWDHVIVGQAIMAGTFFEPMMVQGGVDTTMVEGMKDYPLMKYLEEWVGTFVGTEVNTSTASITSSPKSSTGRKNKSTDSQPRT